MLIIKTLHLNKILNNLTMKPFLKSPKMTKMRNVKGWEKQEYVEKCPIKELSEIMKIRLNMMTLAMNYKKENVGNTLCAACKLEDETTEHVFRCEEYKRLIGDTKRTEEHENDMEDLGWLKNAAEKAKRIEETRKYLK